MSRFPLRRVLPWAVAFFAGLFAVALGTRGTRVGPPAPPHESRDPAAEMAGGKFFLRDADSLEGLPGALLTFVLLSKEARPAGAWLGPEDPLGAAFAAEAARSRERLTFRKVLIAETMRTDAEAVVLWEAALRRPRVTRSRPLPDGSFDVVVQADLAPLYEHLRARLAR